MSATRASSRRKLFAPSPLVPGASVAVAAPSATVVTANGHSVAQVTGGASVEEDAAMATALAVEESRRSYSLRRRSAAPLASPSTPKASPSSSAKAPQQTRSMRTSAKRSRAQSPSSESEDYASGSDFSDDGAHSSDHDSDVFTDQKTTKSTPKAKRVAKASSKSAVKEETESKPLSRSMSKSASPSKPKKAAVSPFDVSPRKATKKPLKVDLEPHEAHPAPAHWEKVYELLTKQRARIVAPVDTMGCEENGREDRRADSWREGESSEDAAKRERLATLVSLMLSSQTKDPVTAEAVYNLQRNLPNGLCLQSLLDADDDAISSCIAKVGFWRRKTGYLKSAARILAADFDGDVPRTVDELCSLPGVGPKMAFLALSSMGIQVGIGVDTHVHRMTNRLGWHDTKTPEQTRLNLQSWLPRELHPHINRLLVGFGQVICVPTGPRCDLCNVGSAGLCPSYRPIDPKAAEKRVKVTLLADGEIHPAPLISPFKQEEHPAVKIEIDNSTPMHIADLTVAVKTEPDADAHDAAAVAKALEW
ncbi:related to NTG1 - DNA repair protein [Moesziomyces antarcticus]|nr:related to NTG1 - DNA repair protein [Moesziomyces antarcticus]